MRPRQIFFPALMILVANSARALCITDVTVIDVVEGRAIPMQTVTIDADRIVGIADGAASPQSCEETFAAPGKYVIPGLWDMHVHRSANPAHWPIYIANGVVGVRDLFGQRPPAEQRQKAAAVGAAPEFHVSGPIIDGPPGMWEGSDLADDADAAVRIVERQTMLGYDFLKIYEFLNREAYLAVLEAAAALEMPVAGHIAGSVTLFEASGLGLRSVEHLDDVALSCSAEESALRAREVNGFFESLVQSNDAFESFDSRKCEALAEHLIANGTWVVPTLAVMEAGVSSEHPDPRALEYSRYLDEETVEFVLPEDPTPEDERQILEEDLQVNLQLTRILHEAGVPMLAGTDVMNPNVFPGFSLHDELRLLVEAGLSELDALRAATMNPALFLGRDGEFGNIEPGMAADLVVLDGNPLDDITATSGIFAVVLNGRLLARGELDRLLNSNRENQ